MDTAIQEFTYGITRLVLGEDGFIEIGEEAFNGLRVDKAAVLKALDVEEIFDVLIENYLEFEKACLGAVAEQMVHTQLDYTFFQGVRRTLARKLSNILSAARLYIDVLPQINNELRRTDPAVPDIKADLSSEYDSRLGYRIMEGVRNHAQHRGLPVHGLSLPCEWKDGSLVYGLRMRLDPEELAKNGFVKRTILDALFALGKKTDMRPYVADYVAGLMAVQERFRDYHGARIAAAERRLLDVIKMAEENGFESKIGLAIVKRDARGVAMIKEELFEEMIAYRRKLVSLNAHFANFGKRFVSGR